MATENLFALLTLLPFPVWLAMLLFPRSRATERLVTASWPFLVLGAVYGLLLAVALVTQPVSETALSAGSLRRSFAGGAGFLAAWAHLLFVDLFVGVWIFRDARYWRLNAAPYLLATLFAGPLGLAFYLWRRRRNERADPARTIN